MSAETFWGGQGAHILSGFAGETVTTTELRPGVRVTARVNGCRPGAGATVSCHRPWAAALLPSEALSFCVP